MRPYCAALPPLVLAYAVVGFLATPAGADQTWLVSEGIAGDTPASGATAPLISADGAWLVLTSSSALGVPALVDTNGAEDVFLVERATGNLQLVSHSSASSTTTGNGASFASAISPDGRYVAFISRATNLIAGGTDTNVNNDAFFWDRDTGAVTLVSHLPGSNTATPNNQSIARALSADGRYLTFYSFATDLIAGGSDTNATNDAFLWDRDTGAVTLVSHAAGSTTTAGSGGGSLPTALSADGRYVAFFGSANNLIVGGSDPTINSDAFLWDRDTGLVTLVSRTASSSTTSSNGAQSITSTMSTDGRYVAFYSRSTDLIAGLSDSNAADDAFLWDRDTGTVTLASHASSSSTTTASGGASLTTAISADGRYLAFQSRATDLIAGGSDTNGVNDAYLWDRDTGAVSLVSHTASSGTTAGGGNANPTSISTDGRYLVFQSTASDLIAAGSDANGVNDTFLWDRDTGAVSLASHASAASTTAGNGTAVAIGLSANGRYLSFQSTASDLIADSSDTNGLNDAFFWDRDTETVTLLSHSTGSAAVGGNGNSTAFAVSADGRYVAFNTAATNLIAGVVDTNANPDAYLWDRQTETLRLISHAAGAGTITGNGQSIPRALSADGRYVAFMSLATNLIATGSDTNGALDAFLWDRDTDTVSLISHLPGASTTTPAGASDPDPGAISADGRYVAFHSTATTLITGGSDSNAANDAFLWDRDTDTVTLISHASVSSTTTGNGASLGRAMSSDGRWVAFDSTATTLIAGASDANATNDAFLWDRTTGTLSLISYLPGASTTAGNGQSVPRAISADGQWVAFDSRAVNLITGGSDGNGAEDVFLWDRDTGTTSLASHAASSGTTAGTGGQSLMRAISADGRYLAFESRATNLVTGGTDGNALPDAFHWDRDTGTVKLVSHASTSTATAGNDQSIPRSISSDGRYVAFESRASNLISGGVDPLTASDAFLWDADSEAVTLASHVAGLATTSGNGVSFPGGLSADGRYLAFHSSSTNLTAGELPAVTNQVYLWSPFDPDTTAPADPTSLVSTDHTASAWSSDATITMLWSGAADELGGSGLAGYSVLFDGAPATQPDASVDVVDTTDPHSTSATLADGWWYFHLSTCDNESNCTATAHRGPFGIDTASPTGPAVAASSHTISTWSNDSTVDFTFSGASDANGVAGYAVAFDQAASTVPACASTQVGTSYAGTASSDDDEWWIHVRAVDGAGNCGTAVHVGPFWVDTTDPSAPGSPGSPSHTVGVLSGDPTIEVAWSAATDAFSGLNGYAVLFDANAASSCDEIADEPATALASTSNPLASGSWYGHVCAVDLAGNWGPVADAGPFPIDATAPTVAAVGSVAATSDGAVTTDEQVDAGVTQLSVAFSEAMLTSGGGSAASAANYLLVEAGTNDVVDSGGCGAPDGDDEAVPISAASYLPALPGTAAVLDSDVALAAGSYRLFACGSLADAQGNALDGNADTTPGDDFAHSFGVRYTDLLSNPNLDSDVDGWTLVGNPGELSWQSADRSGAPTSGSARVVTTVGAGQMHGLAQCVPAVAAEGYRLTGASRVASVSATQPLVGARVEWFAAADCSGLPLSTAQVVFFGGDTAGAWRALSATMLAPTSALSARVRLHADNVDNAALDPSFTASFDDLAFYLFRAWVFADGFETGTVSLWDAVAGP